MAMAIYDSKIPIISAVGHEIDFTIADFVADVRAATPTAAAELATPSVEMLKGNVAYYLSRMTKHIQQMLLNAKMVIANMDRRLDALNPRMKLEHQRIILREYTRQLSILIQRSLSEKKNQYQILIGKLGALNPLAIMDKGYSISSVGDEIITDRKSVV